MDSPRTADASRCATAARPAETLECATLAGITLAWAALVCSASVFVTMLIIPASADASPGFTWPLYPRPVVVTPFDLPERNWLPGHRGVDLAATAGDSVFAVGAGVVVFAGTVADKPVVSIDHPNGLRSTYEPVLATVSAGARVGRGTVIGTAVTGHDSCPGTCVHWGVRRGREYLDPTALVFARPIRLKPLGPS